MKQRHRAGCTTACASLLTFTSGPQGEFENNMYSGAGIYSFPDGAVYDGPFVESQMHGKGLFTDAQVQRQHRHQHHCSTSSSTTTSGTAVRVLPPPWRRHPPHRTC